MQILLYTITVIAAFLSMELVAWFTHKYVMHGFLWALHKDHHVKHKGIFEKNDFFFLIFAIPSCLLCMWGSQNAFDMRFWMGFGIALYGLTYFIIHDSLIHQRVKVLRKTHITYLKAVRKAHKIHHKHAGKERGECYGMLFFPYKYYTATKQGSKKNIRHAFKHFTS